MEEIGYKDRKIIHTKSIDKKGRIYYKTYFNKGGQAVLCDKGFNKSFEGTPNVFMQLGDSKYGDELVLSFNIKEYLDLYPTEARESIEFYLPLNEGLEFMKRAINFIELNKNKSKEK